MLGCQLGCQLNSFAWTGQKVPQDSNQASATTENKTMSKGEKTAKTSGVQPSVAGTNTAVSSVDGANEGAISKSLHH